MHLMYHLLAFIYLLDIVESHGNHDHKISEDQHYKQTTGHNTDYDHDAFLGRGHGHDYDSLEPEEAKRRLKQLTTNKVDTNKDGFVEFEELREWVEKQRTAYMWDTISMVIKRDDKDGDNEISWDELKESHFGRWDSNARMDKKLEEKAQKMEKKFKLADSNNDGRLTREEYTYFNHPEESSEEKLKDIAVDEVIDELDKDGDRVINIKEFLGQYIEPEDNGAPPDWVVEDRKHFVNEMDHNKNGVLDKEEVRSWVLPNRNESTEETKHLIQSADDDADGRLSITEITDHYDFFVGSTATDHGKALHREL